MAISGAGTPTVGSGVTGTAAATQGSRASNANTGTFDWRDLFGWLSVFVGVAAIVLITLILLTYQKTAADVTSIMGVVVSPIVALVSAYFGISAATKGQSQALNAQKSTSDLALAHTKDAADKAFSAALAVNPASPAGQQLTNTTASQATGTPTPPGQ